MRSQNLWNGWNKSKAIRIFLIVYLLLYLILWVREAEQFDYYMFFSRVNSEYGITEECRQTRMNLTDLLQETDSVSGIVLALLFTASVAVLAVYKESFRENWDITLRRIPHYRGKYLFSKIVAVLIPAFIYLVYYITKWLFLFSMYRKEIQRQYDFYKEKPEKIKYVPLEAKDFLSMVPIKPFLEMVLYTVLMVLVLLLISFTVRRIKKDVMGFCVAMIGLVVSVLLFCGVFAVTRAVEIAILSVCIGIILLFHVRHVYVKF